MSNRKKIWTILLSLLLLIGVLSGIGVWIYKANEPLYWFDIKLIQAGNLAELADFFDSEQLKNDLRKKLKNDLKRFDMQGSTQLSFSELMSYIAICEYLSLPIKEDAMQILSDYYIKEQDMFALSKNFTSVEFSFTATVMLLDYYPQILDNDNFSFREGIIRCAKEFNYRFPEEKEYTFYSAGGTVVHAIYRLSQIDGVDYSYLLPDDIENWFRAWQEYDATLPTEEDDPIGISIVGTMLGYDEVQQELQSYYNSLTAEYAYSMNHILLVDFTAYMVLVDVSQNPAFYHALEEHLKEKIASFEFIR